MLSAIHLYQSFIAGRPFTLRQAQGSGRNANLRVTTVSSECIKTKATPGNGMAI